jgi:hypothetical protein
VTDEVTKRPQEAAAQAAGALLGLVIGGPAGALIGAASGPLLVPFAERIWAEFRGDAQARGGVVVGVAAHERGVDLQQLLEQVLAGSEAQQLLAGLAIQAASQTTSHDKIRALGRALANGLVDDEAVVDEQLLLVRALEDLEAPHIGVLNMMATQHVWASWGGAQLQDLHPEQSPMPWTEAKLEAGRPGATLILPTIIGTLERHGLILREDNLPQVLEAYGKEAQQASRVRALGGGSGTVPTPSASSGSLAAVTKMRSFRVTGLGLRLLEYVRASDTDPEQNVQQPRPSED